ncbi:MAG TPA: nucleotide exchange factor GrpE [Candidatus Andersenbacteria bacterium]|nr:nucleotide exchange factor GrpE [Candidatus Andersenbacteria bacterium]
MKLKKEQEYLEGWQRARADLENLQKRMGTEREQQKNYLKRDIAEAFIPLADNFRSLIEHAPASDKDPWVAGVVHIARQFEQTLADFGVEVIDKKDGEFDPDIHEAVEEVEEKGKEGKIIEIVQPGYKIGDVTIRPAKVKVGKH